MAQRFREFDWAATPLGPLSSWPRSLRSAAAMVLECQLPMYLAWGPQFIQIYNDAYRPILGFKDADALGNQAPLTWHEIWPTIGPMFARAKGGEPIGFNDYKLTIERFGHPEDCYFNFSYSALHDDDGVAQGVLVTFAETTEQVQAERRLQLLDQISQGTRAMSNPAEVMSFTAAMLGKHLGVNRCAYAQVLQDQDTFDLLGDYNDGVKSIVGRYRFTDFGERVHRLMVTNESYVNVDVDHDPQTAGSNLSAYRLTEIQAVICVPLHKEGRFVAAMAVHQRTPRRWSQQDVELVQTIVDRCWDSLERLRTQQELHEHVRMLQVLNRTGEALSAELQLDALLKRVTDAATELTGAEFGAFFYNNVDEQGEAYLLYTLSGAPQEAFEHIGRPRPTELFGPTFRGAPAIRIDDVLADPRYGQWEPHHGMPKGHLPVRSYLALPVVSRSGEVLGGLFFGHSKPGVFTEKAQELATGIAGQAATAIDNARLYAAAQENALERERLLESERAARGAAERANVVKDEFLATLSHELRTPLSSIAGWTHILRMKLPASQPELMKGVEVIERSTKAQLKLIDDLLDMGRITSGKLQLESRVVAPAELVQAAVDMLRPKAEAGQLQLDFKAGHVATVMGDPVRLQQVVSNLVSNAIKFSPPGGRISVEVDEDGQDVVVRVSDTGIGIPTDFLPHVFERFRQADGSITRRHGGLGLGLSIVKHIVEAHAGTVTAESAGENQGATFTVRLPRPSTPSVRPGAGPEGIQLTAVATALRDKHVVIVEDDRDSRELLERLFIESGARVSACADATSAESALLQERADVLVSDLGLPGIDGLTFIRRVRRYADLKQLPAVAVTAFARPEDEKRALEAGFDQHFTKPIRPEALLAAVAALLSVPRP